MALQPETVHSIVITGEATVSATPDMVELKLGVQTASPGVADGLGKNASTMLKIVESLLKLGLNQSDMQATGLNIYPIYNTQAGQTAGVHGAGTTSQAPAGQQGEAHGPVQPILGYYVASSLKIVSDNTNRIGEYIDAAIKAGANFGMGISFGVRDKAAVRCAVLEAASRDAQVKARALAAAMGREVGEPITAVEEYMVSPGAAGELGSAAPLQTTPGELVFGARVRFAYGLR